MDKDLRRQAHGELLCALQEFGLNYGITDFIATAPPALWDYTFRKRGWPAHIVGPETDIGYSEHIQTCIMNVSEAILANVRHIMNICTPVLSHHALARDRDILVDAEIFCTDNLCAREATQDPRSKPSLLAAHL